MGEDEFLFDRTFIISSLTGKGAFSSPENIAVNEIAASDGTMSIENSIALAPDAVVTASFDEEGNLPLVTIDGTLTAQGNVSVVIESENVDAIGYGEYRLFDAAELAGKEAEYHRQAAEATPCLSSQEAVLRIKHSCVS